MRGAGVTRVVARAVLTAERSAGLRTDVLEFTRTRRCVAARVRWEATARGAAMRRVAIVSDDELVVTTDEPTVSRDRTIGSTGVATAAASGSATGARGPVMSSGR